METQLHKSLKNTVANELKNRKYSIYFEPLESPINLLWWHSYRPDVLAIKNFENKIQIILENAKPNQRKNV